LEAFLLLVETQADHEALAGLIQARLDELPSQ
jgi:hypothetical protein